MIKRQYSTNANLDFNKDKPTFRCDTIFGMLASTHQINKDRLEIYVATTYFVPSRMGIIQPDEEIIFKHLAYINNSVIIVVYIHKNILTEKLDSRVIFDPKDPEGKRKRIIIETTIDVMSKGDDVGFKHTELIINNLNLHTLFIFKYFN